jgi:uncharacterized protein
LTKRAAIFEVTLVYLDASALVKLVRDEPEARSLRRFLAGADLVSSELTWTEIPRAIRRAGGSDPALSVELLLKRTVELLESIALLPLDRPLLAAAGLLPEPALRSLDAIHLAAAIDLAPIDAFVGYDERQNAAARLAGLRTVAPGR